MSDLANPLSKSHPGFLIALATKFLPGSSFSITFRVGENEAGNRSWIEITEVTGNSHALKYALHMGSSRSDVVSLFQPPEYRIDKNPMRLYTNIVQDPPNMAVWEGPVIGVVIDFDSEDRVTRITVGHGGP